MPDLATRIRRRYEDAVEPVTAREALERATERPHVLPLRPYRTLRTRPRWVYAAVAAIAVLLVVGGLTWLIRPREGDAPPVTEPIPGEVETFLGIPIRPTVSFTAGVGGGLPAVLVDSGELDGLDLDAPGRCEIAECPRLSLAYDAATGRARLELLDDVGSTNTGRGSYVVSHAGGTAAYLAGAEVFVTSPDGEPGAALGEFAWAWWVEICSTNRVALGETTIAGRRARGYHCDLGGREYQEGEPIFEYDLWVDIETGIVLSLSNPDGFEYAEGPNALVREVGEYGAGLEITGLSSQSSFDSSWFSFEAPAGAAHVVMGRMSRSVLANTDDITVEAARDAVVGAAPDEHTCEPIEPPVGDQAVTDAVEAFVGSGCHPPQLEGVTIDGSRFDPELLDGRNTAVLFWASWCPPSVDALIAFDSVYRSGVGDVRLVAVLMHDDRETARRFVDDLDGLEVTIVDPAVAAIGDSANRFYGSWGAMFCPTLVLVDSTGTIVSIDFGSTAAEIEGLLGSIGWLK